MCTSVRRQAIGRLHQRQVWDLSLPITHHSRGRDGLICQICGEAVSHGDRVLVVRYCELTPGGEIMPLCSTEGPIEAIRHISCDEASTERAVYPSDLCLCHLCNSEFEEGMEVVCLHGCVYNEHRNRLEQIEVQGELLEMIRDTECDSTTTHQLPDVTVIGY